MNLGIVEGTVVSTQKDVGLEGFKMLLVRHVDLAMKPGKSYTIAVDAIGAGTGELVMVVTGSSARMAQRTINKPVDAAVIAIIDTVTLGGDCVFEKSTSDRGRGPTKVASVA